MRIPWRIPLLMILWLLAWGEISLANVLSGTAVAAALLIAFPAGRRGGDGERLRVSAAGIARLMAYVAIQLVLSNIVMTRQILRRRPAAAVQAVAAVGGCPAAGRHGDQSRRSGARARQH